MINLQKDRSVSLVFILIALIISSILFACSGKVIKYEDADEYFDRGEVFYLSGEYKMAIGAFKQAINIAPDYAAAHFSLGHSYVKLGKYQEAIDVYKQAIRIKPDYAGAYYAIGVIYGKQGKYQEAIDVYTQAIKIMPDYAEAYYNLGHSHGKLGMYQDAINAYKQAIKIFPDYVEAHYNLGHSYDKSGKYQEAIDAYQQTIKINPDYFDAHFGLGLAFAKSDRYQEAIDPISIAIRINPDNAEAYFTLGMVYKELVEYQKAIEAYKQTIKINPDRAEAHLSLGTAYESQGVIAKAKDAYQQAIEVRPDYTYAHYKLGWAYALLLKYKESADAFKDAIQIEPDYTEAHYGLGVAYIKLGDIDSANKEYEILKKLDNNTANKLLNYISKKSRQNIINWSEAASTKSLNDCIGNSSILGISNKNTPDYCNCVLEKTKEEYPDPSMIKTRLPWDFVVQSGIDCILPIKLLYDTENARFYSNKDRFIFSIFAFWKAFEIESSVNTEADQEEYESLIQIGIDLSYGISNEFLSALHPELMNQYRDNLVKGDKLILKGNRTEDNLDEMIKQISEGSDLANNWSAWWNSNAAQVLGQLN